MEYVTVWFAASVVCAYFAGRKGRSVFGWSMLGLLFPGAAHMILWLLPSLEFNNAKAGASPSSMVCPLGLESV